jgi:TRAP transporter 4TM/12TM fusion protein
LSIFKKKSQTAPAVDTAPAAESSSDMETDLDEVMRKYDRESATRIWEGTPKIIITVIMTFFSLYCLYMTLFSTALPEVRLTLFVGCIIILGFLTYPAKKGHVKVNSLPWYDIVLMLVGSACFFYFAINAFTLIQLATRIEPIHVIIGVIGILVLIELCRRCVGIPILCVVAALLIYTFYNQLSYNPSFFNALKNVVYKLFYTTSGVIGTPINVCFTYIVLFIIFGAFLERTGIASFFIDFANRVAGWSSGGPAKVAVISSALCGMVSGSSVGNTVTTGSVTIPMMKKTGYKPEFAGAVEAAASTGGQIMPPIMGAAAFLMAEYMDLPYAEVAVKAILPAILYFSGIFIAVHLEAKKLGLQGIPRTELPKWGYLLRNLYLILPLVLLVWLVSSGAKTMATSAALSILASFIIGFIHLLATNLRQMNGQGFGKILWLTVKASLLSAVDALAAGAKGAITVAVACAMAGMIAGCITVTGLASILINAIVQLAGNATIVGLVLTMLCCIVLGMGVPTTANYCIMASTCAPILIQLGFSPVAAHFFVFYFGIVADITPPVALAAYAGSAIAKSNPMKTGINATKLAIAAFIVPYIFAYNPSMLFVGNVEWYDVLLISVTALLGLFGIAAALNGHLYRKIPMVLRLALVAGGLGMMIPGLTSDLIGLAVVAAIVVFQYISGKKQAASAA